MTATAIAVGVRREIAGRAIAERPGLGVSELSELTGLHENYLDRLVAGLIDDRQVIRRKDGGLFPAAEASRDGGEVERCPDCFGCGEPCAACVAAAGDPAVEDFVIGPGVEQVRRCGCGRVYGAYRAGRAWCFLMVAPGSRQVTRCVRCGQPLSAKTTSDCTDSPSPLPAGGKASRDMSRTTSRAAGEKRGGIPARTRHELDRAASRLRERFASRPARRRVPSERWVWSSGRAEGCERAIRELVAEAARPVEDPVRLCELAARLLELAEELLAARAGTAPSTSDTSRAPRCAWCTGPIPAGLRPEARFCKKACRQAASRDRLKHTPARSASPPLETCEWCTGPMPPGLRPEARFCKKGCRQAASRFDLAVRRTAASVLVDQGPGDTSYAVDGGEEPRARPRRTDQRAMRFAYADPPYPGKAGYYPERAEVDHRALIEGLVAGFPDGWALSTSAAALQEVLALCPAGVRVCAWQRSARRTRSRRALSAWEPLIVCGGRKLSTAATQTLQDALSYGGRWRAYPGALTGMKPPQFAVWMFAQLGARAGDEFVDIYPGSGAVGEAWRHYIVATAGGGARASRTKPDVAAPRAALEVLRDVSSAAAEGAGLSLWSVG